MFFPSSKFQIQEKIQKSILVFFSSNSLDLGIYIKGQSLHQLTIINYQNLLPLCFLKFLEIVVVCRHICDFWYQSFFRKNRFSSQKELSAQMHSSSKIMRIIRILFHKCYTFYTFQIQKYTKIEFYIIISGF